MTAFVVAPEHNIEPASSLHATVVNAPPQVPVAIYNMLSRAAAPVATVGHEEIEYLPVVAGVKEYQIPLLNVAWHEGVGSPAVVAEALLTVAVKTGKVVFGITMAPLQISFAGGAVYTAPVFPTTIKLLPLCSATPVAVVVVVFNVTG